MTGFVADASCVAAWLLDDETSPEADKHFSRIIQGETVWAPILLRYEVANVLTMAFSKRKRISNKSLKTKLGMFDQIPFAYDPESSRALTTETPALAIGRGLSIYDASYLELAARREIPLATFDEKLRKAARKIGVSVL